MQFVELYKQNFNKTMGIALYLKLQLISNRSLQHRCKTMFPLLTGMKSYITKYQKRRGWEIKLSLIKKH